MITLKLDAEKYGGKKEFNSIMELTKELVELVDEDVYEVIVKKKAPRPTAARTLTAEEKEEIRRRAAAGEKIAFSDKPVPEGISINPKTNYPFWSLFGNGNGDNS